MITNHLLTLRLLILASLMMIFNGLSFAQVTSPLQSGHYSADLKNIRDLANPPSGFFILWYNAYYYSNKFIDKDGNEFTSIKLSQINPALSDINVNLDINGITSIPAIFWASKFKILGGANYMAGISPSFISSDVSVIAEMKGIILDTTYTRSIDGKVSGFSDIFVAPLGLSWAAEKFDITFLYGFYAPSGKFENESTDNLGLGFWTNQFQVFGYYYPATGKSTAIMLGLTYEFNSKIKDADVKPGNRFTLEWGVSQFFSEQFEVGIEGGHNWQVTDDFGSDVYWNPAVHDRKSTLAFNASYWPWKDRLMLNGKYAFDFDVRQRFKNNFWILNLLFVTNLLTGN